QFAVHNGSRNTNRPSRPQLNHRGHISPQAQHHPPDQHIQFLWSQFTILYHLLLLPSLPFLLLFRPEYSAFFTYSCSFSCDNYALPHPFLPSTKSIIVFLAIFPPLV